MTFPTEAEAYEYLGKFATRTSAGLRQLPAVLHPVVVQTTHEHWVICPAQVEAQPPKVCSICREVFHEYPCNAQPVNDGECCAYCDDHVVTPARMAIAQHRMGL